MAALKDKLVNLQGLNYFNRNVAAPHQSSITMLAEAMQLLTTWINDAESRLTDLEYNSGGSVSLASMFQIGLEDEYYVEDESNAPSLITSRLNLSGMETSIGTSGVKWKKPTVSIDPVAWPDDVDDNYNFTAESTVRITFGEAGTLSKKVIFKKPGPGKIYAVKISSGGYVDTGILGNYSYRYHIKGHTMPSNQCVLVDAFVSTTERATARILGGSNKIQHMWYTNKEVTGSSAGMTFSKMFEMTAGANYIQLIQDGKTYTPSVTDHTTSGAVNTNILLLGSTVSGYSNGILSFAEILDSARAQVAYFAPYKLSTNEVIFINTTGLTAHQIYDIVQHGDSADMASHIFRPTSGTLIEVTQAEDES